MCLACEMFWMVAEEPPPEPKRRGRKAKVASQADFACEAPAMRDATPAASARPAKRRTSRAKRRTPRIDSERRP